VKVAGRRRAGEIFGVVVLRGRGERKEKRAAGKEGAGNR
jgi:hypothetical protein